MSLMRNPPPVESPQARHAIVAAYKALLILTENGLLDYVAEGDPGAAREARDAIDQMEMSMSPNLLCTVLPTYSEVEFLTNADRDDAEPRHGIIRDGAWGLFPDRTGSTERRITTGGWEFFVTPETVFTHFAVTKVAS